MNNEIESIVQSYNFYIEPLNSYASIFDSKLMADSLY